MSYHGRLSEQSRRAQDYAPDADEMGVILWMLIIIGLAGFAALIWWAVA